MEALEKTKVVRQSMTGASAIERRTRFDLEDIVQET